MDAFSQILSGVKLNGAVFFSAEFSAPWGFSMPAASVMAARITPEAEHLVLFHLLVEGGAIIELADGQRMDLKPGDIVIFPNGDAHHSSGNATRPSSRITGSPGRSSRAICVPYKLAAAAKFRGSCAGT